MSLSELAERLELAQSVTDGIVRSLAEHGMVVQERGSSQYQLGPAVLSLGNVYLDTLELKSKAIPWVEDLARRTGLAVRTGVLLTDEVVIILHEPSPRGGRREPEVGVVLPVHASALGKAIVAFLPEHEKPGMTSGALRRLNGGTTTSPDQLLDQLNEVRSSGIAMGEGDGVIGESSLASPIFDSYGDVIGAIGVAIPSQDGLARQDARNLVRETAQSVSRALGAVSWPPR